MLVLNNLLYSFTLIVLCSSFVKQQTVTAEEVLEKSVSFHDPNNQWPYLRADFVFESSFSFNDSIPESLKVHIDVPDNNFRYQNFDRNVDISYPKDSCIINSGETSCEAYTWTKNFYTYIWGLPMKLKDPGEYLQDSVKLDTIQNFPLHVITAIYEKETFQFYFHQQTGELKCFEFVKNDGSNHGEFVYLKGIKEHYGIKFPQHRTWTTLKNGSLIGTNEVLSIQKTK